MKTRDRLAGTCLPGLLNSERIVLGELLRSGMTNLAGTAAIRADDFENVFHRAVCQAIEARQRAGALADICAVIADLGPLTADPHARAYLFDLWKTYGTATAIRSAVDRIQDRACRRQLTEVSRHLQAMATDTAAVGADDGEGAPAAVEHGKYLAVRLRALLGLLELIGEARR